MIEEKNYYTDLVNHQLHLSSETQKSLDRLKGLMKITRLLEEEYYPPFEELEDKHGEKFK